MIKLLRKLVTQLKQDNQRVVTGKTIRLAPEDRKIVAAETPRPGLWWVYEDYSICVHELKDEHVYDSGLSNPKYVRSIRFNVEYINTSTSELRYTSLQWLLYDREGYNYEPEIRLQFFGADAGRKLHEGQLAAERRVRGWIAFEVPETAELDYLQFRKHYGARKTVEVEL